MVSSGRAGWQQLLQCRGKICIRSICAGSRLEGRVASMDLIQDQAVKGTKEEGVIRRKLND